MHPLHPLSPTLNGKDVSQKRAEIRRYFLDAYSLFESLFDLLKDESVFYRQSEPTRHPMIFYYGHTAAFFINKLLLAGVISERLQPEFESIFAIGVDEMVWDDMDASRYSWPEVAEVRRYREQVKTLVLSLIDSLPMRLPIDQESAWWVILMGIEHERIHIETSSVLHRQMPLEHITSSTRFRYCERTGEAPVNSMVAFEPESIRLGKERAHHYFGWDNEYGTKPYDVAGFSASKMLVSHGEFLVFVEAGGYGNLKYWDEEGRSFLAQSQTKHPPFWMPKEDGGYRLRLLDREIDLPLDWPVEVNALEAAAYCRFIGERDGSNFRLPTEAEWQVMASCSSAYKDDVLDVSKANVDFEHFASSVPVNTNLQGDLYDIAGNVWQWTSTPIEGFDGFEPHPVYDDFSTPTFDGKHNLIKGGSWASTGNEITLHSRYAFRRHFYQHAGFRYVESSVKSTEETDNIYETDALVAQYCEFQYGESYFNVRNFACVCAEKAVAYSKQTPQQKALDIGCATGRASFELAKVFDEVTGIDFSARFIQVGAAMQSQGEIAYLRTEEGDIVMPCRHTLAEFGLEDTAERVTFWQGDACNLKAHFTGYDLILATNLIDRLYEPERFLSQAYARLNDDAILVLTSPYTWLEEYTQKAHWIGGYMDEMGATVYTLEGLKQLLEPSFELIGVEDVPFVIRETARKFQHTVAQMTVWKKC